MIHILIRIHVHAGSSPAGTFGQSPHPVVLSLVPPMLKMCVLDTYVVFAYISFTHASRRFCALLHATHK